MSPPKSILLTIAGLCLGLAIVTGILRWRESTTSFAQVGSEVRFSALNDMTWDATTRQLVRTGHDPYAWIELPPTALPVRRVTMEFEGTVDPVEGHFYFYQSITNPIHLGINMVEAAVTVKPGVLRVQATLDNSQCLRIDLPDFLLQPLKLRRLVIEQPFFNAERWTFLTMVGAGMGLISALGILAVTAFVRRRGVRAAMWAIFAVSAVWRIGLAVVNREAGDDHLKVTRIIMEEWRLPKTDEDWEGFQPKLYHATVAVVARLLLHHPSPTGLILTGQALSCLAGLAALGLAALFLAELAMSDWARLWAFAFTAFNPKLVAISAQATNDSFLICFGALSIYAALRYLKHETWTTWLGLTAALCLATLTKASGLVLLGVLPGGIALTLIWRIWRRTVVPARAHVLTFAKRLAVLVCLFAILVPVPGQYFQRFKESGTPFATNIDVQPKPHWSKRTYEMRPGIISLRDGFLTFPLRSLLQAPMILNHGAWGSDQLILPGDRYPDPSRPKAYPYHMVSLWAQLYGSVLSAHFDFWPPSWQSSDPWLFVLGRIAMVAGLLPLALGLLGVFPLSATESGAVASKDPHARAQHLIAVLCALAFLAFVGFYAVRIRDFSAMKAIFLFPAWLAFIAVFARGVERAQRVGPVAISRGLIDTGLGLVCLLGLLDTAHLALQLASALAKH